MTYKGYTIEQIRDVLDYDPENGQFKSKISNKVCVNREFSLRHSETKKVTTLSLARLAIMFTTDDYLNDKDRVIYKDGDIYNLSISNLVVVPYEEVYQNRTNSGKNEYLETEYPHIYVGSMNKLFVVRRGSDQGIYRTYDKDEAVAVMNRWLESGKTLHEWDSFTPKWYRNWVNGEKSEESVKIFAFTP
jgi:hypothetical protein